MGCKKMNRLFPSSSIHRLNADRGLSKYWGRLWFLLNRLNNSIFPNLNSDKLEIRNFSVRFEKEVWQKLPRKQSPSRTLSDLFWLSLPWKRIMRELGEIHILDSGCGTGKYGPLLQNFSNQSIKSYTGFDHELSLEWQTVSKANTSMKFEVVDSQDIFSRIPKKTNFFVTQSAIEHFEEDLTFFSSIKAFVAKTTKPIIQVHIFPSAVCLRLFQLHGVRQYSPRTVSRISRMFESRAYTILFGLGNSECNSLHWDFITKPIYFDKVGDFRETRTDEYQSKLLSALKKDMQVEKPKEPGFYSLVMHSNWKTRLFD